MQDNIPDALIAAFERHYDCSWDTSALRNERLAWRAAWAAAMESKQCLHQIQEPAAAPAAVAVPDGWKLVPIVPTEAMLIAIMSEGEEDAARELDQKLLGELMERAGMQQRYANVLAAAPALAATPAAAAPAPQQSYVSISGELKPDVSVYSTPAAAPAWDGKLPERLQRALNELRIDCKTDAVSSLEFEVRSAFEGMHTSLTTVKRMYHAAQKRLDSVDAAQPDPFVAAAPVVLPPPDLWRDDEGLRGYAADPGNGPWYTAETVRALLAQPATTGAGVTTGATATGLPALVVEQVPVLYVSKEQLDHHRDPDGPDSENAGRYLPARKTPAGKLTTPLFAAPQAQADARDAQAFSAAIEKLPRYTYGFKSDDWGMGSHLQSYQDPEGKFLNREEVIAAIAVAKGESQ